MCPERLSVYGRFQNESGDSGARDFAIHMGFFVRRHEGVNVSASQEPMNTRGVQARSEDLLSSSGCSPATFAWLADRSSRASWQA